jgi:hypothetical protein
LDSGRRPVVPLPLVPVERVFSVRPWDAGVGWGRKLSSQERIWSKRPGVWTVVAREGWWEPGAAVAGSAKPRIASNAMMAVSRRTTRVRDIEHPS